MVPGKCRFFGLFGRADDYVIPWQCIRRFGEDIILVEVIPDRVLQIHGQNEAGFKRKR